MKQVSKSKILEIKKSLYVDQQWVLQKPKVSSGFRKKLKQKENERAYKFYKENKKKIKKERNKRLLRFSDQLNRRLPPSEKWFWNLYDKYKDSNDIANRPWGPFIYDIFNSKFKYVVEVDGESHNCDQQKRRDDAKNKFAIDNGFKIIRVKAYSRAEFEKAINDLNKYRSTI